MVSRTAQGMTAVVAVAVYGVLWLGWRLDWGWLDTVDTLALRQAHDVGVEQPWWVPLWRSVCAIFGPSAFRLAGVGAIIVALVRRRVRTAVFLLVTLELCEMLTHIAKRIAQRPRPATALVAEPSWSFPSGHALAVTCGILALLTVALPLMHRSVRAAAVLGGALIVVAVGAGRVALNVHYVSDVLAGWSLGYLYFLVCLRLTRPVDRRCDQDTKESLR